jgi:hypothetical protein
MEELAVTERRAPKRDIEAIVGGSQMQINSLPQVKLGTLEKGDPCV